MRLLLAIVAAVTTLVATTHFLAYVGASVNVYTGVDLPYPIVVSTALGPAGEDREVSFVATRFGIVVFAEAAVLAIWVGQAIQRRSWRAGWENRDLAIFQATNLGLLLTAYAFGVTELAFRWFRSGSFNYIHFFTDIGASLLVLHFANSYRKVRLNALEHPRA